MTRASAAPRLHGAWPPPGRPRLWLAVVMVVAAALRVAALDKPLYIDEIVTITVASQPLASMASVMRQVDASPALYPLLLHVWLLVSHADGWVRLLSAIFGVLAVAAFASVASRAFGWRVGLAAAAVMAIAPVHVHYAQYVRSYSLFTLLGALHVRLFIDWMYSTGGSGSTAPDLAASRPVAFPTRSRAILLTMLTAALCYTHYLSALLFVAEGVFALWRWRAARARVLSWAAAVALGGLLFAPGVPLFLHNVRFDGIRNLDRPVAPPAVKLVPNLIGELSLGQRVLGFDDPSLRRVTFAAAAVVFPGLWLFGSWRAWRAGRRDMVLLLTAVAWIPVAIYVGSGRRLVAVRFFLPFMVGYIALLGYALAALPRKLAIAAWTALALLSAVPLWHFYASYSWSYDHRRVAAAIGRSLQPGDELLFVHPYEAFYYRWYLGETVPMQGMVFTALEDQQVYVIKPPPVEFAHARARIEEAAARHPRLWVVGQSTKSFASDAREEGRIFAWMDQTYRRLDDLSALTDGDPTIRLYATPSLPVSSR
ncbi:MAG: hypothetical protein ABI652_08635 [Acidobacteriota bacterium]